MHASLARALAPRRIALERLAGAGTLAAFAWLLFDDRVHPLLVYLIQLYLSF